VGLLVRPGPILTAVAKRSIGLLKEGEVPDEPVLYQLLWAKAMFALCIGVCYASVSPFTSLFSFMHLGLTLMFTKRNLLYSYTHKIEARGQFWPDGCAMFLLVLGTAQLVLGCVHASKASWGTAGSIFPLIFVTWRFNIHIKHKYAVQLETMPLAEKRDDSSAEGSVKPNAATIADVKVRFAARLQRRMTIEMLVDIIGSAYIQPELLHAEVSNAAQVEEMIWRSSYVAAASAAPYVAAPQELIDELDLDPSAVSAAAGSGHDGATNGPPPGSALSEDADGRV